MKRALIFTTVLAATWAAIGAADGGGGSPGTLFGSPGVISQDGKTRYLALLAGRGTVVESVATRGGAVRRSRFLHGWYGVPMVAYDGSTGGLARNGRRLLLVSSPANLRRPVTRFVVLDPRTLGLRDQLALQGNFAFDALSPGGSVMYLIQYLGVPGPSGWSYAVRALNLNTRRLYPGAIVDTREPDEKMTGVPITRAHSRDGGWAYTLYSRTNKRAFVHALDTSHRRAFCVDLPWNASANWVGRVRMHVDGRKLVLRLGHKTVATVDTTSFEVSR
jgi:hypothetical protein